MSSASHELVARALAEDLGAGDVTASATVPAGALARATIVRKAPGVIFGLDVAAEVFAQAGAPAFERLAPEGRWEDGVPGDVAAVAGPARAVLAGERTALNFLGHLSGVATLTARYVEAVAGTGATILDTRKTTPGMRGLEKAAVRAGGGANHRFGLHDAVLIKENHAAIAGGVGAAVEMARAAVPGMPVEVECRSAAEVSEALDAGAERLLLDNMDADGLEAAVAARDGRAGAELEASGGVTLENVAEIAATGVEFISVGALTHSAPSLDLSLLVDVRRAENAPVPIRLALLVVAAFAAISAFAGAPAGACACGIAIEATVSEESGLVVEGDGSERIILSLDLSSDGTERAAVVLPVRRADRRRDRARRPDRLSRAGNRIRRRGRRDRRRRDRPPPAGRRHRPRGGRRIRRLEARRRRSTGALRLARRERLHAARGREPILSDYVDEGWKFVAIRLAPGH